MERVAPLLKMQRQMQVSARVTVTPRNLFAAPTLDAFRRRRLSQRRLFAMLERPQCCGRNAAGGPRADAGRDDRLRAANSSALRAAADAIRSPTWSMRMREIHRGTHRPYPCGAGAGYLGVSAEASFRPATALSATRKARWARSTTASISPARPIGSPTRHVHRQEPCRSCWARYLCGGGCHHEVIGRGRPACDYIRGWLHYCLEAYLRLSAQPEIAGREFAGIAAGTGHG